MSRERELIRAVARNVISHVQLFDWGLSQWARNSHHQRERFIEVVAGAEDHEVMHWTLKEWHRRAVGGSGSLAEQVGATRRCCLGTARGSRAPRAGFVAGRGRATAQGDATEPQEHGPEC